jgi:hypothetical protein
MAFRALVAMAAGFILAACEGGGSASNGGPNNPGTTLDRIRALTNAAPPAETAGDQHMRSPDIVSRADSLLVSTIHRETGARGFARWTSCSGTACTISEPTSGLSYTVRLSDLGFAFGTEHAVGTKHGITLIRSSVQHDGTDYRTLGAWMNHSGFVVQTERSTVEGIRVDARYGIAIGDLTGCRGRWEAQHGKA